MHYRSNTVDSIYEESNTVDPIYEESNTVDPIYEESNTVDPIYEESNNTVDPIYEKMDTAEYEEMTVLQENIPTTDPAYVATKATASATPDYENTNI